MQHRLSLVVLSAVLIVVLPARPASAGIFFGKKTKTTPTERVPELLKDLKTDGDEHKRSSAAEELRQYDPQQFPEIIPALIDALLNDNKPGVRAEAAQTLGKLRPVNVAAGNALEQALARDGSMRVRLQARSSLLQYRWAGYTSGTKEQQPPTQSKEPPLAPEPPAASAPRLSPVPATSTSLPASPPAASAPRLSPMPAASTSLPASPRPLPLGPAVKATTPAAAGVPAPANRPAATPTARDKTPKTEEDKGPDLTPP
jgi:hypothetical protein